MQLLFKHSTSEYYSVMCYCLATKIFSVLQYLDFVFMWVGWGRGSTKKILLFLQFYLLFDFFHYVYRDNNKTQKVGNLFFLYVHFNDLQKKGLYLAIYEVSPSHYGFLILDLFPQIPISIHLFSIIFLCIVLYHIFSLL